MNRFNPQWYGFAPVTDKQVMNGSAPFIYNTLPSDSQICLTVKTMFNNAHSAVFTSDTIVRSHPASAIIQSSTLQTHENMIKDVCNPSFKIDTNIHHSLGMPSPSFS